MILLSLLGPLRPVLVLALFCVAAYAEDSARPAGTWHFDEDAEEQLAEIQQRIYDAYRAGNFEGCHAGAKEKWALIRSQLGDEHTRTRSAHAGLLMAGRYAAMTGQDREDLDKVVDLSAEISDRLARRDFVGAEKLVREALAIGGRLIGWDLEEVVPHYGVRSAHRTLRRDGWSRAHVVGLSGHRRRSRTGASQDADPVGRFRERCHRAV